MSASARFVVGIDLGTTNSAVSYADLGAGQEGGAVIKRFRIPQLTGPGEVSRLSVLPSFLYLPGAYEISKEAIQLPWPTSHDHVSGAFARDHGARVPARLVSSAKSWLCHSRVDRNARILPWGAAESVGKVSPVQAAAAYLTHIRQAWNHARGSDPDLALENQMVVITVPASFDEVARDLTVAAAGIAGLQEVLLIEEPLAAFYSWLMRYERNWQQAVTPGQLILVCDVGGGTTDFTLITLRETDGSPRFERLAVGDHLLLGGDNMDLALARCLEGALAAKKVRLTGDRYKMLCHQCRQAKEEILGKDALRRTVTLVGEGSRLIAGTVRAELSRETVHQTVLDGFFPLVAADDVSRKPGRKGIGEFGLPYEAEPAITRHLGNFLHRHQADVRSVVGRKTAAPDLILFNGGALKPPVIQDRIRQAIRHWFGMSDVQMPRVLENPEPDLAVSLGAAYYGLVKTGRGVRVGSGSARAYYLGVSRAAEKPSVPNEAVCLVERGLDEGSEIRMDRQAFQVRTNRPVQFDVYSSTYRTGDRCGDVVLVDDSFTRLPPLQTVIAYGKKGVQTTLPVQVEARYTEMGTLALWCRSGEGPHRWRLQFQLRDGTTVQEVGDRTVLEASRVAAARDVIRDVFSGRADSGEIAGITKRLAAVVDLKKENWPLSFIRTVADALLALPPSPRAATDWESRWMNLLGYCLRPGRGDAFDAHRVKALWKRYKAGPLNPANAQVRSEWWVLWRRVAGGMAPGHQRQLSQDLTPVLGRGKGKKSSLLPQERLEIWMLLANLEQLLAKDKVRWGALLLEEIRGPNVKPQLLWSLSRLGARELLYGPADRVVPPDTAAAWCERLMDIPWKRSTHVLPAVARMARRTGDRLRDVSDAGRDRILRWMTGFEEAAAHARLLEQVVPMAAEEESRVFGEALPAGLVLHEGE